MHPRTERLIDPDRTPLDVTALAHLCHKSRWWMTAVAKHPETPFSGKYSTLTMVTDWIFRHPEFRAEQYYEQRTQQRAEEGKFLARLNRISA